MPQIIPAIMPKKFSDIEWSVAKVNGMVKVVQLDIMDGKFVKNTSWPYVGDTGEFDRIEKEEQGMPAWESIEYELDLMIMDADKEFEKFIKLGPKRIVFHVEAMPQVKEFLENLDPYYRENIEFGIAINTTTPISTIADTVRLVDFVQCMGIEKIGYQGQLFDERVLDQIRALREHFPGCILSVDGAVNEDTAPRLIAAGADRLVIGSVLWKSDDIEEKIFEFKSL
ncbi:MAG: hypothetical protein MUD00_01905 [Candidatus Pacebacteria bacterium]|jgi:ribulose-phosphate 3-epimerase|nr:hypothetical protein [Candidatus Paceibacterota bacterium]